jgi:hypothetical protein
VIDWFAPLGHTKYPDIMTEWLNKELYKYSNTSGILGIYRSIGQKEKTLG